MKHNEYKNTRKFMKSLLAIVAAAAFAVTGYAIGTGALRQSALADTATTETTEITDVVENPAVAVYEKCADSVVGVITYTESWSRSTGEVSRTEAGEGSGVVISDEGYILTNYHVVKDGTSYGVILSDGSEVDAKVVGVDSGTDLAVIKVEGQTLKAIEIGSSADLKVGEIVIAIGNPGGKVLANSVTEGIVSALERDVGSNFKRTVKTIQHDAAINPGNSGGALLNTQGQLVGINTLKLSGSIYSGTTYEGLGFAIPVDLAFPIAEQIIEYGEVRRPALGIACGTFSGPDEPISNYPPASVVISSITEDGPAAEAGLQPFDFITEIDGQRITSINELIRVMDTHAEGDTVKLKVLRYDNTNAIISLLNSLGYSGNYSSYGGLFGFGNGYSGSNSRLTYQEMKFDVTLRILTNNAAPTEAPAEG